MLTFIHTYLSYSFFIASDSCGKTESQDYDRNAAIPNIGMHVYIINLPFMYSQLSQIGMYHELLAYNIKIYTVYCMPSGLRCAVFLACIQLGQ